MSLHQYLKIYYLCNHIHVIIKYKFWLFMEKRITKAKVLWKSHRTRLDANHGAQWLSLWRSTVLEGQVIIILVCCTYPNLVLLFESSHRQYTNERKKLCSNKHYLHKSNQHAEFYSLGIIADSDVLLLFLLLMVLKRILISFIQLSIKCPQKIRSRGKEIITFFELFKTAK